MLRFSTYHIEFFFQNSFWKFSKKIKKKNFLKILKKKKKNWKFWKTVLKKKFYMISWKTKHFSLLTFFENLNFWNNDILFYLFFDLNDQRTSQDWYRFNEILFLSLGEQDIKIAIWGRVLLCSWFYVVNLPFG